MMKKNICLAFSMAIMMASCQNEEQPSDFVSVDNAVVTFGMDFDGGDNALTRAAHNFEYYVAISADDATNGNITSGYVGRFTSLSGVSVSLDKGVNYTFYISAFESTGSEYDLSTYCAAQGEFVAVTSPTSYAPAFPDKQVDRYYGSTSQVINGNTVVTVQGNRFAYGINVIIETPLVGRVLLNSSSPAFSHMVTSQDDPLEVQHVFCLAGTDPATASKTTTIHMRRFYADGSQESVVTKEFTIARNHSRTIVVRALKPNVSFDFEIVDGDMVDETDDITGGSGNAVNIGLNDFDHLDNWDAAAPQSF